MNSERREPSTRVDHVQFGIESLILKGKLLPGEHIKEQALADRLGTSRGPVREACRALERAGLVESIPHRGVFVKNISIKDVCDIFDVRAQLSGLAAHEITQNMSPKYSAMLMNLVDQMDAVATRHEAAAYHTLNLDFHEKLYSLCDNAKVQKLDRELGQSIALYRRRGIISGGGIERSNIEHRRLVQTLASGDADQGAMLLRQHILNGKARFCKAMSHTPAATQGSSEQA